MLTLTDQAAKLIEQLRAQAAPSADVGLRIAKPSDTPGLTMTLTDRPGPQDLVVLDRRTTVFLDPVAAARLNHQVLDARSNETGSAFFLS